MDFEEEAGELNKVSEHQCIDDVNKTVDLEIF